jgi:hypothetical protein
MPVLGRVRDSRESLREFPVGHVAHRTAGRVLALARQNQDSNLQESGPSKRNYSWAQMMMRVLTIDVLACERCGGRSRIIAAIQQPEVIRKILDCLPDFGPTQLLQSTPRTVFQFANACFHARAASRAACIMPIRRSSPQPCRLFYLSARRHRRSRKPRPGTWHQPPRRVAEKLR